MSFSNNLRIRSQSVVDNEASPLAGVTATVGVAVGLIAPVPLPL